MVYGIAQRHNAEIEIESALGQGTTMRLLFPGRNLSPAASRSRRTRSPLAFASWWLTTIRC